MKFIRQILAPALSGLIIYAAIVAVNDSALQIFWTGRPRKQIIIEIISCIVLGIAFNAMLQAIIYFTSRRARQITPKLVLFELLLVIVVSILIFNPGLYLIHYLFGGPVVARDLVIGNILVLLFIIIHYMIMRGYRVILVYVKQQTDLERVKNEQLQTELKFLKGQYHPHFLFNALNTVYFQMDEDVAGAKNTIERLSGLLRYQLYEHSDKVRLSAELEYVDNFIRFMQERMSASLDLRVSIGSFPEQASIYPLLLQPLVENAFKHAGGVLMISIDARKVDNNLVFRVVNSIASGNPVAAGATVAAGQPVAAGRTMVRKQGGTASAVGGIGQENLVRRLALLYPVTGSLTMERGNKDYIATLMIPLSDL